MSLQYIIDGYNIINHPQFSRTHKKGKFPQAALLDFIKTKRLTGSPKNIVTIVFDGYPPVTGLKEDHGNFRIMFTKEETADEKIRRLVEKSGNPKNIVVVSDDREIRFFISSCGARPQAVEEFIGQQVIRKGKKMKGVAVQAKGEDLFKPELTYGQVCQINKELKKIWLKNQ